MTRASVALAQMRRLRTWVSSRRSTTPNAPLKADRQEASVPLRADGSPVWAFRSPGLRIAAPSPPSRGLHLSGFCWTRAPRSQLRDSSGFTPDSLGTHWNLSPQGGIEIAPDLARELHSKSYASLGHPADPQPPDPNCVLKRSSLIF